MATPAGDARSLLSVCRRSPGTYAIGNALVFAVGGALRGLLHGAASAVEPRSDRGGSGAARHWPDTRVRRGPAWSKPGVHGAGALGGSSDSRPRPGARHGPRTR